MILYIYTKNYQTMIVEEKHIYYTKKNSRQVLDNLCYLYGSTMEGRRKAVSLKLMIVQMVPILISEVHKQFFFPVVNGEEDYWWINYQGIQEIIRRKEGTLLLFRNGKKLLIQGSYRSILRQMRRCELYLKMLSRDTMEHYLSQLTKWDENQ